MPAYYLNKAGAGTNFSVNYSEDFLVARFAIEKDIVIKRIRIPFIYNYGANQFYTYVNGQSYYSSFMPSEPNDIPLTYNDLYINQLVRAGTIIEVQYNNDESDFTYSTKIGAYTPGQVTPSDGYVRTEYSRNYESLVVEYDLPNTAPTIPGAFTQPTGELEIGDSKVFSVGSSSDAENNLSKYVWESSINGGSFTKIGETPTNNINYTIPTAKTLKIRVKAVDSQGLESSYRESAVFTVTKPKYYWSKYNILNSTKWSTAIDARVLSSIDAGAPENIWSLVLNRSDGYWIDNTDLYSTITITSGGAMVLSDKTPFRTTGDLSLIVTSGSATFYCYTDGTNVVYQINISKITDSEWRVSVSQLKAIGTPVQNRGSLIQSGIIAEEGTYPTDGVQSGYWWVRGSRVNQSIAPPGPFTSPVAGTIFKPNDIANILFGASNASNISLYEVQYNWNGNGFTSLRPDDNTLSRVYIIPTDKTILTIQFRVRAKNTSGVYSDWIYSEVYTIQHNVIPTILLNTADNFTMSETEGQNEVIVDGSAKDMDANDNIIIKMQINDGTIRNIQSGLSDGSTPIEFSKKITYSNKRVYDGATPISNDLSENVDHTLKVWADDGQGGISTVEERTFRVIHNRPPVISGTDEDLGELLETPSITYQVDDPEKQTATITERINGQVIRTFDAELGTEYKIEIPIEMWIPLQLEQEHKLTIEAKDTFGAKSTRTYTFTRIEDTIQLELKNPFVTDIAATRILVTPDVYLPIGSTIVIEACNNAFDEVPTWEDITGMAMNKRGFNFTNTEKTAEQWGINIRFTINKGTAHDQVRFNGFGGAFD